MTIPTPNDAFDLNYVFGDGDGNFDNNGGLDYKTWMLGTMTVERWEELQPDRQVLFPPSVGLAATCVVVTAPLG